MQVLEKKVKHQRLVLYKFWDYLKQGKMMTLKCNSCGTFMFPPVPTCRNCFGRDLDWAELSGEGELLYYSSSEMPAKPFLEFAPFAYGGVKMKEGPIFLTRIEGVDISSPAAIVKQNEKLPIPVRAELKEVRGLNTIIFRAVKRETD